jgi:DNA-3-methyladenine glycosylase
MLPREFLDRSAIDVAPELLGCVLEHETADGLVAVVLTEVEAYAGEADPASHAYRGRTRRNAVMYGPPGYAYVYFTYGMHFCVNVVCSPPGTASAVLVRAGQVIAGEDLARHRRSARGRAPGDGRPPVAGPSRDGAPDADQRPVGGTSQGDVVDGGESPAADSAGSQAIEDRHRQVLLAARDLARGPARLCQALGIDRALDGADLCVPESPLRLRAPAGVPRTAVGRSEPDGTARSGNKGLIRSGPRVGVRLAADVPWRFWLAGGPSVSAYRPYARRR